MFLGALVVGVLGGMWRAVAEAMGRASARGAAYSNYS